MAETNKALKYIYKYRIGKPVRKVMTHPLITAAAGAYMNTAASVRRIVPFIEANSIDLDDYEQADYKCFNDFFTRRIRPELRPVDMRPEDLISPCDGHLSAYRISPDSVFTIKDSEYNIYDLVGGDRIASEYLNGLCLVLRLGVENYHRYCYIDNGTKGRNYHIRGRYHTVQPIAVRKHPVFVQNTREYTVLHTENFGDVIQIEVGACLVGRIKNHDEACNIRRGREKGMFMFGGSTIVLMFKEGKATVPGTVFAATAKGEEIPVLYGQQIGRVIKK